MIGIYPASAYSYPFDFLRVPFHGAASRTIDIEKATGANTGWNNGDTVYAVGSSGRVVATAASTSGVAIGTAVGPAGDDAALGRVTLGGNNAIASYEYRKNGVSGEGAFIIGGTVSAIWNNAGYITPAGDNSILVTDQWFDYLLDGSDFRQLLIMWREQVTANQTADRTLVQIGSAGKVSPGGAAAVVRTTSRQIEHWPFATAGDGNVANKAWNTQDLDQWFAGLIDYDTDGIYMARDGELDGASLGNNNGTTQTTIDTYPFQGTSGNHAFTILCGNTAAGAANDFINASTGNMRISDLLIAKNAGGYDAMVEPVANFVTKYREKRIPGLLRLN